MPLISVLERKEQADPGQLDNPGWTEELQANEEVPPEQNKNNQGGQCLRKDSQD